MERGTFQAPGTKQTNRVERLKEEGGANTRNPPPPPPHPTLAHLRHGCASFGCIGSATFEQEFEDGSSPWEGSDGVREAAGKPLPVVLSIP